MVASYISYEKIIIQFSQTSTSPPYVYLSENVFTTFHIESTSTVKVDSHSRRAERRRVAPTPRSNFEIANDLGVTVNAAGIPTAIFPESPQVLRSTSTVRS